MFIYDFMVHILIQKEMSDFAVSDGRVPRAWLQSPHHFFLRGPSAHAIPAGVAVFHFNPISRKYNYTKMRTNI